MPGVGRCLDRGLQRPRGGKPPLARGEQSDPRTVENADCSGFAARLRALGPRPATKEIDALETAGSKENGYFAPRVKVCKRIAMAKSHFGTFPARDTISGHHRGPVVSRDGLPGWSPGMVSRWSPGMVSRDGLPVVYRDGLPGWSPGGLPGWSPGMVSRDGLPVVYRDG
eukprot:gene11605-biopygen7828